MKRGWLIFVLVLILIGLVSADVSYRYVKWEVIGKKGVESSCVGQSCIQASEFVLLLNNNTVSWPIGTTATNPNGVNPDGEGPANTIDGNTATKWLDYNFNPAAGATSGNANLSIDVGAGNTVLFNGYKWSTANDVVERDPVSWALYGSDDGSTWAELDTKSSQTITDSRYTYTTNYQFDVSGDDEYPLFSDYWDNNGTLTNSGTGLFNVTLTRTNGTVFLEINNTNYTASNVTDSVYNVSVSFALAGTYPYIWHSWGNGSSTNYNTSEARDYTINSALGSSLNASINLNWISPTTDINVSQNTFFNVSVNVSCSGSDCGAVNVSLDPDLTQYNITACGNRGTTGPNQTQCNAEYSGTNLAGDVDVVDGIQYWTVPSTGNYNITIAGASGGDSKRSFGGKGRVITATVSLTSGQILKILVGQKGGNANYSTTIFTGGGGGGTFIVDNSTGNIILVAGGGGGAGEGSGSYNYFVNGSDANGYNNQSGTKGIATASSYASGGAGGTNGNGGALGHASWDGGSGAGFYGNGSKASVGAYGGVAFISGGSGGANVLSGGGVQTAGGFGGGGGAYLNTGYESDGGAGGGYSGGGASGTRVGAGGGKFYQRESFFIIF